MFAGAELVIKVRVANSGDPDFIEVELPMMELTYYTLLRVCCEELGLSASQVVRIRKLPDTVSCQTSFTYIQILESILFNKVYSLIATT